VTDKKSNSTPSEEEDRLKEIMDPLYNLEERTDKDLKKITNRLKEMLERLIEKKIEYYL